MKNWTAILHAWTCANISDVEFITEATKISPYYGNRARALIKRDLETP